MLNNRDAYMRKLILFLLLIEVMSAQIQAASAEKPITPIKPDIKVWYNGIEATRMITGINLKVGEPAEIKAQVTSNMDNDVGTILLQPYYIPSFDVLSGPSKINEKISNQNVTTGSSKTYIWKITPNGNKKNSEEYLYVYAWSGDSPDKMFGDESNTSLAPVAAIYIVDKQYTGDAPQPTAPGVAAPKAVPFPPALGAIAMLLAVWVWRRLH